jgi:hypothetical protein
MIVAALVLWILSQPFGQGSLSTLALIGVLSVVCLTVLTLIKRPLMLIFAWYDRMKMQDSALAAVFRVLDSLSAMMTGESPTDEAHKRA